MVSTALTVPAEQIVKPVLSNLSCYFKHISNRNKGINHVKNLCYHKTFCCFADTRMTQTCRSLAENATRWQNHSLWSSVSALTGRSWRWGPGQVCDQVSCIFLFHGDMLNIPRLHAETIAFFSTSCHSDVSAESPIVTAACRRCLPVCHISTRQQK